MNRNLGKEENEFVKIIENDEQSLWAGFSKQGLNITKADLYYIPISILIGGFTIPLGILFLSFSPIHFFTIFIGILFLYIGIYITAGRFFLRFFKKKEHNLFIDK